MLILVVIVECCKFREELVIVSKCIGMIEAVSFVLVLKFCTSGLPEIHIFRTKSSFAIELKYPIENFEHSFCINIGNVLYIYSQYSNPLSSYGVTSFFMSTCQNVRTSMA